MSFFNAVAVFILNWVVFPLASCTFTIILSRSEQQNAFQYKTKINSKELCILIPIVNTEQNTEYARNSGNCSYTFTYNQSGH